MNINVSCPYCSAENSVPIELWEAGPFADPKVVPCSGCRAQFMTRFQLMVSHEAYRAEDVAT